MEVYTIGFAGHSAEEFFDSLKAAGVERLLDVRRNNVSQLAGFTKRDDLRFFLSEIMNADYVHDADLAPSQPLLKSYRSEAVDWATFEAAYLLELSERLPESRWSFDDFATPTVLLCSEHSATRCHRRLLLEHFIRLGYAITPVHL